MTKGNDMQKAKAENHRLAIVLLFSFVITFLSGQVIGSLGRAVGLFHFCSSGS
jgi:hypothetical protein